MATTMARASNSSSLDSLNILTFMRCEPSLASRLRDATGGADVVTARRLADFFHLGDDVVANFETSAGAARMTTGA